MLEQTIEPSPNNRLREERRNRGWTQAKVAEMIGSDTKTVGRWERGEATPSLFYRQKLCGIFEKDAIALGLKQNETNNKDGLVPLEPMELTATDSPPQTSLLPLAPERKRSALSSLWLRVVLPICVIILIAGSGIGFWLWPTLFQPVGTVVFQRSITGEYIINCLQWSPEGKHIAFAKGNKTIDVIDAKSGDTISTYHQHTGYVNNISWSPDGQQLASVGIDQTVQIWNATSGQAIFSVQTAFKGLMVSWSPNGKYIAYSGFSNDVKILDYKTRKEVATYTYKQALNTQSGVWAIGWSRDSHKIATGYPDGSVHIWSPDDPTHPQIYSIHTDVVNELMWSPDDSQLVSSSNDFHIRIFDASTGQIHVTYTKQSDAVDSAEWSHNGKMIASASEDNSVHVWDARTGNTLYVFQKHKKKARTVSWSPDDKYIASGSNDATVQVWIAPQVN